MTFDPSQRQQNIESGLSQKGDAKLADVTHICDSTVTVLLVSCDDVILLSAYRLGVRVSPLDQAVL